MSLLEAVTNVADEAGYTIDTAIIGSDDVTTKSLLAMANRKLAEMADKYPWRKLWKSASFDLVTATATYAVAADFSYNHFDTFWNQDNSWPLYGPLSPQDYATIQGYGFDDFICDQFTIRGVTNKQILISPTPGSAVNGQTIIYEYIAARPARPRTWAQGQSVAVGSYTFYNGNYYTSQTLGSTGATPPTHTSSTASDGTITWEYYSGAYLTFLADTDEPVLSQRILEQGILERFGEIKGFPVPKEFDRQLDEEFSKEVAGKTISVDNASGGRFSRAYNERVIFGTPRI